MANVLLPCGAWPLSTSTFSAGSGGLQCESYSRKEKKLRGEWLPSAVVLLEQGDAEAQRGGCCFREVSAAGGGDRGVKTMQLLPQMAGEELSTECMLE